MNRKVENLEDIALWLGSGDPTRYKTVESIVDGLIEVAMTDKVFTWHDDTLGLKSYLSKEFLCSPWDDLDTEKFESEIEDVVSEANEVIWLFERDLTEEEEEEIREENAGIGYRENF